MTFKLNAVRNIPLGVHQKIARQPDDALIRATTGRWWQFRGGGIRDVYADDGKVAIVEFPNVRATDSLGAICARGRAKPAKKDWLCIHSAHDNQGNAGKMQE